MDTISNPSRVSTKEKRFVIMYILTLAISFSPFTQLGQISAFFFYAGVIFFVGIRPAHHIRKILFFIVLYIFIGIFYWVFLQDEFWFVSYLLFFATMSSFLVLIFDFTPIVTASLIRKIGLITLIVIFLEAAYGIFQALFILTQRGTIGDMIWGTLGATYNKAYIGRMPPFIILLSTLLLVSLATLSQRIRYRHIIVIVTVAVCWLLAKIMHTYVYFIVAAIGAVIFTWRFKVSLRASSNNKSVHQKRTLGVGIVIIIIIIFLVSGPRIFPNEFAKIPTVLKEAVSIRPNASLLKNRATYNTIFDLPKFEWVQPFIGLGPGQYASRASLMVSGEYLQRSSLPFIPNHINTYTKQYILPRLGILGGSTHLPISSWIALYGEMGLAGLIILVIILIKSIKFFRSYSSPVFPRMSFFMLILLLYILFMGFQNVYWEYTQAIFPAVLVLKLSYDYLRKEKVTLSQ